MNKTQLPSLCGVLFCTNGVKTVHWKGGKKDEVLCGDNRQSFVSIDFLNVVALTIYRKHGQQSVNEVQYKQATCTSGPSIVRADFS